MYFRKWERTNFQYWLDAFQIFFYQILLNNAYYNIQYLKLTQIPTNSWHLMTV